MNSTPKADDTRTELELVRIARRELDHIEEQLRWRRAELDGQRVADIAGRSSPGPSDPTYGQASSRRFVAAKIDKARGKLATLVDSTLPSIYGAIRLDDERPRVSDENDSDERRDLGPARLDGGLSAYRGDRRAPKGRPDLKDAIDAQHRRLAAGGGYGNT